MGGELRISGASDCHSSLVSVPLEQQQCVILLTAPSLSCANRESLVILCETNESLFSSRMFFKAFQPPHCALCHSSDCCSLHWSLGHLGFALFLITMLFSSAKNQFSIFCPSTAESENMFNHFGSYSSIEVVILAH